MFTVEDLAWLIGVLEDWLLHASDDTSADLAAFVGHGAFSRPADQHARVLSGQMRAFKVAGGGADDLAWWRVGPRCRCRVLPLW